MAISVRMKKKDKENDVYSTIAEPIFMLISIFSGFFLAVYMWYWLILKLIKWIIS